MKFLLLMLAPVLIVSCRTITPLDPHTMKPTTRCLPENMQPGSVSDSSK